MKHPLEHFKEDLKARFKSSASQRNSVLESLALNYPSTPPGISKLMTDECLQLRVMDEIASFLASSEELDACIGIGNLDLVSQMYGDWGSGDVWSMMPKSLPNPASVENQVMGSLWSSTSVSRKCISRSSMEASLFRYYFAGIFLGSYLQWRNIEDALVTSLLWTRFQIFNLGDFSNYFEPSVHNAYLKNIETLSKGVFNSVYSVSTRVLNVFIKEEKWGSVAYPSFHRFLDNCSLLKNSLSNLVQKYESMSDEEIKRVDEEMEEEQEEGLLTELQTTQESSEKERGGLWIPLLAAALAVGYYLYTRKPDAT